MADNNPSSKCNITHNGWKDLFVVKEQIFEGNPRARRMLPETPPFDRRFPNTNQSRNCFVNYVDFYRCQRKLGEDSEECNWFKLRYTHICPQTWINRWDEMRENGLFPSGDI